MEPNSTSKHERLVVLDTETTGLHSYAGDRIVEVGCVELIGNLETGNTFHRHINPGAKKVDAEAVAVHGLTDDFLSDKPKFREIAKDFFGFIGDSSLVIHNAPFDMGFIEAERRLLGLPKLPNRVIDTLRIARLKYPGQKVSLDVLCSRLGVDASARELHGALIDASLLAQVYVKMMGLDRLAFAHESPEQPEPIVATPLVSGMSTRPPRNRRPVVLPSDEEIAAFRAFIADCVKNSSWGGILELPR